MTRPLVSVITPTWLRSELLSGCVENVQAQGYRPLEHVVVSDGPDPRLAYHATHALECRAAAGDPSTVPVRAIELGRNWSTYLRDSFCAAPITVGMLAARGDYQTWLADDERMEPDHIEALVHALESRRADFAYGKVRMHAVGQPAERGYDIGSEPPTMGQITNVLYRADLLRRGLYPFGAGMVSDWCCIERWMAQGATWAYVPRVTLTHRYDH